MCHTYHRFFIFLFAAVCVIEACLSIYLQTHLSRFEDIVVRLNGAERILRGEVLYRDIISNLLPIDFYLRIPQILIARHFGLGSMYVSAVFDNIVALASIMLTLRILRKIPIFDTCSLYFIAVLLVGIYFLLPYHENAMGQQEYFFWACSIPYFTLTGATAERVSFSRRFRLVIGAFAAFGFCYKPFYVIPLVMVEACLCFYACTWRSVLRAETIICVALGVAYLVWIPLAFPQALSTIAYLFPFYYEWHFGALTIASYFSQQFLQFLVPAALLWVYMARRRMVLRCFLQIYSLVVFGYAIAAIAQLKADDFDYHLFPTFAMTLMTLAVSVIVLKKEAPNPERNVVFILVSVALASLVYYCGVITVRGIGKSEWAQEHRLLMLDHIAELQKQYPSSAGSVFKFGSLLNPVFPEGYADRGFSWDYHFYDQWLLWGIQFYKMHHRDEPPQKVADHIGEAEFLLNDLTAKDFECIKPGIILEPSSGFDYVAYYSNYAPFAEQMKYYLLQEQFDGYKVYTRKK